MKWITAEEENVSHFEIEESTDGSSFRPAGGISSIPAQNTLFKNNYTTVISLNSTVAFYRLKMVDIDGKYRYSNIIMLNAECLTLKAKVYPNPAKDNVLLEVANEWIGTQLQIINSAGAVIEKRIISNHQTNLDIRRYASGMYLLKLENGDTIKLIKE